ncbi:UNVERIFIED_CONTAM: hypothetical protein NCL1_34708 [Trichonephila clavipes]
MNCQTKLRINPLTAVKSVAILEMALNIINIHLYAPAKSRFRTQSDTLSTDTRGVKFRVLHRLKF